MVDNIAGDARLLQPVQHLVRELQPALQRLVLQDPRFFSDRRHPARRLLEQMTQRSLAWESVQAPGFAAFVEPLQQAVEALVGTQVEGAEPFDFALRSLEEAWGDVQQRDRRHREKAVRALLQAEQRNLLAEKIAKDMRMRPDVLGAPREIGAFIAGPWAQVMAQARLADGTGASDPGGFAALVADLVWSAQPRIAAGNVARLVKLGPPLLEKLEHGLATIDYPALAARRFIEHVARAHEQAVQSAAQPGRPAALSTSMTRDELEAMLGGDEDSGPGPWLGPTEAQESGFMQTHQTVVPKPLFQETQPAASDIAAGAAHARRERSGVAAGRVGRDAVRWRLGALPGHVGQSARHALHVRERRGQDPFDDAPAARQDAAGRHAARDLGPGRRRRRARRGGAGRVAQQRGRAALGISLADPGATLGGFCKFAHDPGGNAARGRAAARWLRRSVAPLPRLSTEFPALNGHAARAKQLTFTSFRFKQALRVRDVRVARFAPCGARERRWAARPSTAGACASFAPRPGRARRCR